MRDIYKKGVVNTKRSSNTQKKINNNNNNSTKRSIENSNSIPNTLNEELLLKDKIWLINTTVQVLGGRGLASRDLNGLSDPYCIVGLSSPSKSEFLDKGKCITSEVLLCVF